MVLNSKSKATSKAIFNGQRLEGPGSNKSAASLIIGALVLLLSAGGTAFGRLVIQPLQLQMSERPNKMFSVPITLKNMSNTSTEDVELRIVDITQDPNGLWDNIELYESNPNRERSAASWLTLAADKISLEPNQEKVVMLKGRVAVGTRGHYSAGILAITQPRAGIVAGRTANMVFKYLVPIVIEAKGFMTRDEVKVIDAGLQFVSQTMRRDPATLVTMTVQNKGITYVSLNAKAFVYAKQGDHWRKMTETNFDGRSILPGETFTHQQDVGRPLATGTYKVQIFLYVNGRRTDFHEAVLQFQGDSRIDIIDQKDTAPLVMDPSVVDIQAIPGAMRMGRIAVSNFSEEDITIDAEVGLPDVLASRTLPLPDGRTLIGERLGCNSWLRVEPSRFTIRGYQRKNVRIVADMPEAAGNYPHYYATINLRASYQDGQSGGTKQGYAFVTTRGAEERPLVEGREFPVRDLGSGRYLAVSRFVNMGDTHVRPIRCSGLLLVDSNNAFRRRFRMAPMEGLTGYMLPMMSRQFTGALDVSDLDPGDYRLVAVLESDKGQPVSNQQGIRIKEENGIKTVEVLGVDAIGGAVEVSL